MDRPFLTIVSGLPRSGTSMMMAALQAGGLPLLLDEERLPDDSNPRGYYEYQPVRQLADGSDWLADHLGKAVKIIYRLLYHVPAALPARIVFMERDLQEVARSQQAMLGGEPDKIDWPSLFARELHLLKARLRDRSVLFVSHRDMLAHPLEECGRVAEFLGESLDVPAMARTVDQTLYRQRA